jgi:photosystem II stability/assembly factor-like uncharacterized protein
MKKNILGFLVLSLFIIPTSAFALDWTEQTSSGAHYWNSIASSFDGINLVAVDSDGGYIYTSDTSGATWTQQTSSGPNYWQAVTSSADGSKLAAVAHPGFIYTSTDGGNTWVQRTLAGNRGWQSIASSSNGTKLAAVDHFGYIYTSADSGATWTAQTGSGIHNWKSIASSSNGNKLVAVGQSDGVYTSTDSGVTWTLQTAAGTSRNWTSVASSADGNKLAATVFGGKIYTSTDSGVTWTARDVNRLWYSIASSSNGNKLVATVNNGHIYTSIDSGATWTQESSAGYHSWLGITTSADGTKFVVGGDSMNIYTGIVPDITPPTILNVTSSTPNGTYTVGKNISTLVQFSEPVVVTGTPQITLETGSIDKIAQYVSGSGTDTLVFSSVITSGDITGDLDYTNSTALSTNGGVIKDLANNNAFLTLATPGTNSSLSINKDISIDTIAPTITLPLISPAAGSTLTTSAVSVVGAPGSIQGGNTLTISNGNTVVCTTNIAVDGSFNCGFQINGKQSYTIRAYDQVLNAIKVPYTLAYFNNAIK